MIRITFTEEQVARLRYERFHHLHPRVQKKMEALLPKSQGLPHKEICRIVGITANTFPAYLREFLAGGVEALKEFRISHSQGALDGHRTTLEVYFREHPPATVKEAPPRSKNSRAFGVAKGQVRKFLKSLGMRRLKAGYVPAKADPEKQERFKEDELEPRLDEASAGRRVMLFVDGAHFVLAPFVGYLWCIVFGVWCIVFVFIVFIWGQSSIIWGLFGVRASLAISKAFSQVLYRFPTAGTCGLDSSNRLAYATSTRMALSIPSAKVEPSWHRIPG